MVDFYLFRHGETDMNRQTRWQGSGVDSVLNANGAAQAQALAERLKNAGLEIIFTSPLKRAAQTAEIVARTAKIGVVAVPELVEACLGDAEGRTLAEIKSRYADISKKWHCLDDSCLDVRFPNGESKREIQTRMVAALEKLARQPYKRVGISVHSAVMRCFLLALGIRMPSVRHGTPYVVHYENGRFSYDADNPFYSRGLELNELPAAADLIRRTFLTCDAPEFSPEGVRSFLNFIDLDNLTAPENDIRLYGCFKGTRCVGVAGTRGLTHICLLFVDKTCQNTGAGTFLVQSALERARLHGDGSAVTVNAAPRAVGFYRKAGFEAQSDECVRDGIRFVPMTFSL